MNCCAYCTSASYPIKKLYSHYHGQYKTTHHREVIHVEMSDEDAHVYFFAYGAIVFWNISNDKELEIIEEVSEYAYQPLKSYISEGFTYKYGEKSEIKDDEITLPNKDPMSKLAFSYGMAQSVKLESFEILIESTFEQTKHIPEELAQKGKISLSRRQVRRKMGDLYLTRNSITLHVDVLDLPDFFWEYPELEPMYDMVAVDLDIKNRDEVLTRRLDTIKELWDILSNEVNHQHSSRLEWIIIWLIAIEVVITLGQIYKVI